MSSFVRYPKKADADGTIRRFEPAYWTVDFPISMMATAVTTGVNALRVKLAFRLEGDLAGLIWHTEDRKDAGTFAYPRRRDYRGCTLAFDWVSSGIRTPDLFNGAALVIETFDAPDLSGVDPSTVGGTVEGVYYVNIWDYKTSGSTADNFSCAIPFDTVVATPHGGGDPVTAPVTNIRRLYFSLPPSAYVQGSTTQIGETAGQLDLTNIAVTGANSTLPIRTAPLDAHALRMTDGYDNAYPFTPERLVGQVHNLGYRGPYVLYMGISKFHSLVWDVDEARYVVDPTTPLNAPTIQWLTDFFERLDGAGYTIIVSVSFEILGMYMPDGWNQRDFEGNLARTGWEPPSGLIRPTSAEGLEYLRDVFLAVLDLLPFGADVHFQIGEPWWWDGSFGNHAPHIYDADTLTLYNSETGLFAPTPWLDTVFAPTDPIHIPYLEWCRDKLGEATAYLQSEVLAVYPAATSYILVFTPQITAPNAPMLRTLNFPEADWAAPAFDVLQIEDYDFVIADDRAAMNTTWRLALDVLGYALEDIHYFAGFNLLPSTSWIWHNTDRAIWQGFQRGPADVFVWSREQVQRDGWLFDRKAWKVYPAVTRLAQCWRIERTDGVTQAFTSHDKPLIVDGVTYQPANSFSASQLSSDTEMSVADVELLGAIDSDDIAAADILAGVYDHAAVELFLVDWSDLTIPPTVVRRGWIGTIGQAGPAFKAELRGLGQRIQQPVIDSYSAECRVDLFSTKCGLDRNDFDVPATVTALTDGSLGAASDNRVFFASALTQDAGYFEYGEVWWTSGNNNGRKAEVRSFEDGRVELWEPMGLDIAVGDTFTIYPGCNKAFATCKAKFDNVLNFRGEPHVPGNDAMLRYPDPHA